MDWVVQLERKNDTAIDRSVVIWPGMPHIISTYHLKPKSDEKIYDFVELSGGCDSIIILEDLYQIIFTGDRRPLGIVLAAAFRYDKTFQ